MAAVPEQDVSDHTEDREQRRAAAQLVEDSLLSSSGGAHFGNLSQVFAS